MTATTSKLGADMTRDDAIHMVKEYARSVVHERNDQTAMRFWHIVNLLARQPAAIDKEADDDIEEAREILENMVRSIELDGNYSTEATCTFLRQALLCIPKLGAIDAALTAAQSASASEGK